MKNHSDGKVISKNNFSIQFYIYNMIYRLKHTKDEQN